MWLLGFEFGRLQCKSTGVALYDCTVRHEPACASLSPRHKKKRTETCNKWKTTRNIKQESNNGEGIGIECCANRNRASRAHYLLFGYWIVLIRIFPTAGEFWVVIEARFRVSRTILRTTYTFPNGETTMEKDVWSFLDGMERSRLWDKKHSHTYSTSFLFPFFDSPWTLCLLFHFFISFLYVCLRFLPMTDRASKKWLHSWPRHSSREQKTGNVNLLLMKDT